MRIFFTTMIMAALSLPSLAGAGQQIKFISEFTVDAPLDVAAAEGKLYVLLKSGDAVVFTEDGKPLFKLEGKDKEGKPVLKEPSGITIWGDTLYLADSGLDCVVMFKKDGGYRESFGGSGGDPKEFDDPAGIFVHGGVIYVADSGNGRVQVFGSNGVYLRSVGKGGSGEGVLKKPVDVAVDFQGDIYVVDAGDRVVKIYGTDGIYKGKLSGVTLPGPIAMADDGIYLADREKCNVTKFAFDGQKLFSFGIMGEGRVRFRDISGIFALPDGKLYVSDSKNSSLQVLLPEQGKKVAALDRVPPAASVKWMGEVQVSARKIHWDAERGELYAVDDKGGEIRVLGDGEVRRTLKLPKGVAASGVAVDRHGALWVADQGKDRLLKLDKGGKILLTVGSSGSREGYFSKLRGVAVSRECLVYAADTGNNRVQVFDTDGVFLRVIGKGDGITLENIVDLCVDENGMVYILDGAKKVVAVFGLDGKRVAEFTFSGNSALREPAAMAVSQNELFILDAGSCSVKVFTLSGEYVREFGVEGKGKGDFKSPTSLAVTGPAAVMVADGGNNRIQTLALVRSPLAPTALVAKSGMRGVELTWDKSREHFIDGYKIYRAEGDGEYKEIAAVKEPVFADRSLVPDVSYSYRVTAVALGGNESAAAPSIVAVPEKYAVSAPGELKAQPQEWSVELSWKGKEEEFLSHYVIYREVDGKAERIGESATPSFLDGGLDSATPYVYQVAAVSKDDVESQRATIAATTLAATRPPIEIEVLDVSNIFSNSYKIYETEGIGKIRIVNNTRNRIASLKVAFSVKEYMDFPTEVEVKDLPPRDRRDLPLKAVLNNRILEVTEDTPVQTEFVVSYYENQRLRTYARSHTLTIYEKHRMLWSEKGMVAAFITPKDPVILDFARSLVTQYGEMNSSFMHAGIVFDALGLLGVSYMQDPSNPYQIVSEKTDFVDYVQFPRETLRRKSGDCDDLVILYAAALESLGIRTLLLDYPGHMLMMFAAGPVTELGEGTLAGMFVIRDGFVWIPVEVTMVGSSFMKAWEGGIRNYYDWEDKGLAITDPAGSWEKFKPASLPVSDWRPQAIQRNDLDKKFDNEIRRLRKIRLRAMAARYTDILAKNPGDQSARLQMGILYAEEGETEEAEKIFRKYDLQFPESAAVANNLGNIHYLQGDYEKAAAAYEKAAELDPSDPHVLVNLARCYLKLNARENGVETFKKACALNPDMAKKYRTMALELMGVE